MVEARVYFPDRMFVECRDKTLSVSRSGVLSLSLSQYFSFSFSSQLTSLPSAPLPSSSLLFPPLFASSMGARTVFFVRECAHAFITLCTVVHNAVRFVFLFLLSIGEAPRQTRVKQEWILAITFIKCETLPRSRLGYPKIIPERPALDKHDMLIVRGKSCLQALPTPSRRHRRSSPKRPCMKPHRRDCLPSFAFFANPQPPSLPLMGLLLHY